MDLVGIVDGVDEEVVVFTLEEVPHLEGAWNTRGSVEKYLQRKIIIIQIE